MFPPWVPVWPSHTMKHKLPIKMIILLLVLKVKSNDVEKYAVVWHIIYIIATKHCTKAVRKIKLHSEENPVPDLQREKRSCIPDMRPDGPYHNQFWVYPPLLSYPLLSLKYTHTQWSFMELQCLRTLTPAEDSQKDEAAAAILVQGGTKLRLLALQWFPKSSYENQTLE